MFSKVKSLLVFLLLLFAVQLVNAQPPDGGGGGEDPDAAIPIDGGIGFLAAAGIGYGISVLRKKKSTVE